MFALKLLKLPFYDPLAEFLVWQVYHHARKEVHPGVVELTYFHGCNDSTSVSLVDQPGNGKVIKAYISSVISVRQRVDSTVQLFFSSLRNTISISIVRRCIQS